jgi:hypothetical protein
MFEHEILDFARDDREEFFNEDLAFLGGNSRFDPETFPDLLAAGYDVAVGFGEFALGCECALGGVGFAGGVAWTRCQ